MRRCLQFGVVPLTMLFAGCLPGFQRDGKSNSTSSLWGNSQPVDAPPASTETASRVDALGRQILAANPTISFRPTFMAIGTAKETVFHQGSEALYISDGLVKRCKTEGELAAILCHELGKMASEKEALAMKDRLQEEDRAPILPPVTRDIAGGGTTPDRTEIAERSQLEAMRPRRRAAAQLPPADPHLLARGYLTKAGFKADELTKVGSLLKAAELNPQFEQQLGNKQ
jgi:hypothetical protein